MPSPPPKKTLAFFGATGDSAGFCLAAALNAGHTCTALARTPSKLTASLIAKNVTPETQSLHLRIVHGDIHDPETVKQVLTTADGAMVDAIISGIGGAMSDLYFTWNPFRPVGMRHPHICQEAVSAILAALGDTATKPRLVLVSTTGLSPPRARGGGVCKRDVPLALVGLYRWLGAVMHDDKSAMERVVREARGEQGGGYCFVRPSLLVDGEARGLRSVKVGVDDRPVLGYTITRADVGGWVFENLVKGEWRAEWVGTGVTLTQ